MRNLFAQATRSFKLWRQRRLVTRHFGTAYPESVQLPDSQNTLFLDPHDPRAYKILLASPLRGQVRRNQPFWRQGCTSLTPDMALDIGLNFGECLFAPTYAAKTEIHGFDANPRLQPFVERSRCSHPDGARMQVHFGLVADKPGPSATFYIDREWSGGSSAVPGLHASEKGRMEAITVPVSSVDAILGPRPARFGSLLFKIDVEGYEFRVLQGMQDILAACTWSVGLLEFDPHLLQHAGEDLAAYWNFLASRFQIFAFHQGTRARPVSGDWKVVQSEMALNGTHMDLIVVGGTPTPEVSQFLREWTTDSASRRVA
jgi:FkbM family methyltransferase